MVKFVGWAKHIDAQEFQVSILKKLYAANGLNLTLTSPACPELYEVFKGNVQVAYYRLRHGEFLVHYPTCGGKIIYECTPFGDGMFDECERLLLLAKALRVLLFELKKNESDNLPIS